MDIYKLLAWWRNEVAHQAHWDEGLVSANRSTTGTDIARLCEPLDENEFLIEGLSRKEEGALGAIALEVG